jgi:hypothetical protein
LQISRPFVHESGGIVTLVQNPRCNMDKKCPQNKADNRCEEDENERLRPPCEQNYPKTGFGYRGSGIAANKRVGRARGQAEIPSDQIPGDCSEEPAEYDRRGNDRDVNEPFADSARY